MPPDNCPRTIAYWMVAPHIITSRTIAPENNCHPNNCPRGKLPPWMIAPGQLPQRQLPPGKIVFQIICRLHNCPLDKWPRRKLPPPQENCPKCKLHLIHFSPKNLKSIVASSCSPSLRFKLILDFDFCIKKTLRDWNCLKKKSKPRTNQVWNNETELFMLS